MATDAEIEAAYSDALNTLVTAGVEFSIQGRRVRLPEIRDIIRARAYAEQRQAIDESGNAGMVVTRFRGAV